MAYYTICTRDGYRWAPQFGDFDREVVKDELDDEYADYHPDCIRIVRTHSASQAAIDAAVADLNRNDPETIAAWGEL